VRTSVRERRQPRQRLEHPRPPRHGPIPPMLVGSVPNRASANHSCMAYIIEHKSRFYVVAYDGIDPRQRPRTPSLARDRPGGRRRRSTTSTSSSEPRSPKPNANTLSPWLTGWRPSALRVRPGSRPSAAARGVGVLGSRAPRRTRARLLGSSSSWSSGHRVAATDIAHEWKECSISAG